MAGAKTGGVLRNIAIGFIAGALGVLFFHQIMAWFVVGRAPWSNWNAIPPFGIPGIVNTTFWGGVWGIVFAMVANRFPKGLAYLFAAFVFGALAPTLVGWFVVPLIKGGALGPRGVWYNALLINGAWGLGTGVCLVLLRRVIR
jgi:hypothetical protein